MIPYILAAVGGYLIGDSLKGKQYANGGELESDRKKALEWWSSLSINEQKEYSKKHLSPYNYDLIWDYSLSKHISPKKYYDLRVEIWKKETYAKDGGMMAKGGAVKRFIEMKGDKPVYALADAIYHVSFGTLNDKGFPVTTGTHKVYRTASGLKKIKEYKKNPEYSVLEEKTDDKGILWHITFVANKSFMMDGKETKDVVSFDIDDLYANGGMTGGKIVEDEIFEAINKIYSDPNNKDQYGQVAISEYTEYKLKKMLSDVAFDYLKSGKSAYGKFSTYGGRFGTYSALSPTSEFYQRKKMKADGGVMAKGGMVVTSIKDIPNFKQRLEEGKITYRGLGMGKVANDFYDLTGKSGWRIKVDGKEYYITEEEFDTFSRDANGKMRIRFDAPKRRFEKGGTIEEQLEKIDVYNDLDEYEYRHYVGLKKHSDLSKVDALKIIINDAEGDTSQLSKKLASIAKKIKYSDGGRIEPELPHRYKIGDKVTFMNADYSTGRGKIVKQEVRYINMNGYNLYLVELENGKITPVAESDISDDYSKNRKFYNPD